MNSAVACFPAQKCLGLGHHARHGEYELFYVGVAGGGHALSVHRDDVAIEADEAVADKGFRGFHRHGQPLGNGQNLIFLGVILVEQFNE